MCPAYVVSVDNRLKTGEKKKDKSSTDKKRKNKDKSLVGRRRPKGGVDLEEKSGELVIVAFLAQ